jgi:hypothetical protein
MCLIFSADVEAQVPLRLREGDVITMGTTELMVRSLTYRSYTSVSSYFR